MRRFASVRCNECENNPQIDFLAQLTDGVFAKSISPKTCSFGYLSEVCDSIRSRHHNSRLPRGAIWQLPAPLRAIHPTVQAMLGIGSVRKRIWTSTSYGRAEGLFSHSLSFRSLP